jgi:hypothetical protein
MEPCRRSLGFRRFLTTALSILVSRRLAATKVSMGIDTKLALAGLAAVVIGGVQVSSILVRVASANDSLTAIHALQLFFCGSLLEVGILALINVWQQRRDKSGR